MPIAIKSAGDGEVIFDGDGAHNLFDLMAANYSSSDYGRTRETRKFKTLQAFSDATGQDNDSILVDYDVFQQASAPAGVRLPNINDDFIGRAADLGAYEAGRPVPHYGPRP